MKLPLRSFSNIIFQGPNLLQSSPFLPLFNPSSIPSMNYSRRSNHRRKIVVIIGATGSGKSRLSVDLATRFNGEVINSDKIQVYSGLNITTNKIPPAEQLGIPHHLLGVFESSLGELTQTQYRRHASSAIADIAAHRRIPILAGGSNSFIYALLAERFNPANSAVFSGAGDLRYKCCFLWVDVSLPVLNEYLIKRVDQMLESDMFDELACYYNSEIDDSDPNTGLRKAIGVPEFEGYFRRFGAGDTCHPGEDPERRGVYEEAVRAIKGNTCQLAKRQREKIQRLRGAGWDLQRLDATEAFREVIERAGGERGAGIWERQVLEPSMKIVKRFLEE